MQVVEKYLVLQDNASAHGVSKTTDVLMNLVFDQRYLPNLTSSISCFKIKKSLKKRNLQMIAATEK